MKLYNVNAKEALPVYLFTVPMYDIVHVMTSIDSMAIGLALEAPYCIGYVDSTLR